MNYQVRGMKLPACILRGTAKQVWMVRAGRDSVNIDEFLSRQMVAIEWARIGDLSNVHSREQIPNGSAGIIDYTKHSSTSFARADQ